MKMGLFDICVLGPGLGGLINALLLQKRGAKILLLDHEKHLDEDFDLVEDVQGFSLKPTLIQAGFHPQESSFLHQSMLPLQLIMPHGRVSCYSEDHLMQKECEIEARVEPKNDFRFLQRDIGGVEVFKYLLHEDEDFIEQNAFQRFRTQRKIQKHIPEEPLRSFPRRTLLKKLDIEEADLLVRCAALSYYRYDTSWTTQSRVSHLLECLRENSFDVNLGIYGLKKALREIFLKRGGKIDTFSSIEGCSYQKDELSSLTLQGAMWTEVQAKYFVIAGDQSGLFSTDKDIARYLAPSKNRVQKRIGRLVTFLFEGKRAFLPENLSTQGIIIPKEPDDYPLHDRRRFLRIIKFRLIQPEIGTEWIGNSGASVKTKNDEPDVYVGCTVYVGLDWNEDVTKLENEIFENFRQVAPYFQRDHFSLVHVLFKHLGEAKGDFRDGFVYSSEKPTEYGVKGNSMHTGLKNLFVINREILPGLGLDGEILAARELTKKLQVHFS
ncbi:MAG: hypothetical protein R3A11_03415 [Bdellovibrionota bacterium]